MPIYEYKCKNATQLFQSCKNRSYGKRPVCPDCGSNVVKNYCPYSLALLPEAIHSLGLPGRACGGSGA